MFPVLRGIDSASFILLALLWGLLALMLASFTRREHSGKRPGFAIILVIFNSLLTLLKVGVVLATAFLYGWPLVEDRVILTWPMLLPALGAIWFFTLPRLWKRERFSGDAWYAFWVRVPVQLLALGMTIGAIIAFFVLPQSPYIVQLVSALLLPLAWLGIQLVLVKRQQRDAIQPVRQPGELRGCATALGTLIVVLVLIVIWFNVGLRASVLPGRLGMASMGVMDYGNGAQHSMTSGHHHDTMQQGKSVDQLKGPQTGEPDVRYTLIAQKTSVTLTSGAVADAWTFNGQAPGPELRAKLGDLVEVTLINNLPDAGVTIHWHGLDVPNAEDGVAGVTQNAVQPGGKHVYRFRALEVGTFWYHSHQQSNQQVAKGLFGPLIILPPDYRPVDQEMTLLYHDWKTNQGAAPSLGIADTLQRVKVIPGQSVRLRLVNTDNLPKYFILTGTSFRVVAIDGNDVYEPTEIRDKKLLIGSGAKYDLLFQMPASSVRLGVIRENFKAGYLFSPDGTGDISLKTNVEEFRPETYGSPRKQDIELTSTYDRQFTQVFDGAFGFFNGTFETLFSINGQVFPNTPMMMVKENELVKVTFVNRSYMDHPMHLHGHHMVILSRNGKAVTGSPWIVDTVNVAPGETYEVAFRADNPGLWMDHCHNLTHAVAGMSMHVGYEGITSPYEVGADTTNHPE